MSVSRLGTTARFLAIFGLAACAGAGCSSKPAPSLTLATTTSARDTGLLDVLTPKFREQTGIEVKVVAVGTGQALELGRRGDADVLVVHDPVGEKRFMAEGYGSLRRALMYNDFILVGPTADPAGVKGEPSITEALARIARQHARFVSRGDESGTHQKEKRIWQAADITPTGDWYIQAGSGMAHVLSIADEKMAYTLSDRGTYLAQRQRLELVILSEGDSLLVNPYSVMLVNPERHPHVHDEAARKFVEFLFSPETQKTIAGFGVDRYGEPLFHVGEPSRKTDR